jgi:rhodanese-related sulfurtransferase
MQKVFGWLLNIIAVISAFAIIWQITHKTAGREVGRLGPQIGSAIREPGLKLSTTRPSAILAVSLSCPYCRSSKEFYRALLSEAHHAGVQVIPVLAEEKEADISQLTLLGFNVADGAIQKNLATLEVSGTPTILLVDKDSRVTKKWEGKLNPNQEKEVFGALGLPYVTSLGEGTLSDPNSLMISASELKEMLRDRDFVVVDTRDRQQYKQAHIRGALSIPLDEFLTRAPHEVPTTLGTVAIVCPAVSACAAAQREEGVASLCDMTRTVVADWAGFRRARLVPGDLCALQVKGVPIEGNPK